RLGIGRPCGGGEPEGNEQPSHHSRAAQGPVEQSHGPRSPLQIQTGSETSVAHTNGRCRGGRPVHPRRPLIGPLAGEAACFACERPSRKAPYSGLSFGLSGVGLSLGLSSGLSLGLSVL